jgi:mannosyl-3-phosphoglycerate phosphatase
MSSDTSKLLIFTDLDATLLDHNYSWDAAAESLMDLRALGFPVVLNSSKTIAEMTQIADELGTAAPLVAENGALTAVPQESPLAPFFSTEPGDDGYCCKLLGKSRHEIVAAAHELRDRDGYAFAGFSDWVVEEVAGRTGLNRDAASRACQRLATEPIVWEDSEARWEAFADMLAEQGIRHLRGGRFIHLMGASDKAQGLVALAEVYRQAYPGVNWRTVALGDSPNDLQMLSAADIAVVIPNDHHDIELRPDAKTVIRPEAHGPLGWHEAMQVVLQSFHQPDGQ